MLEDKSKIRWTIKGIKSSPLQVIVFLIRFYQNIISPLRLPTCRFIPTCSQYAIDALTQYGLIRGGWLTLIRLLKCGPWCKGGWDPVVERMENVKIDSDSFCRESHCNSERVK